MLARTRRRALLVLVPLAAVPLLVAATHGSRHLTVLGCGSTITTNTTLAADLGPCPANGVTIGANGVTLNLNGHQISGSNNAVGVFSDKAGVTVENGRVTGFVDGVHLQGEAARVVSLRVGHASSDGIFVAGRKDVVSGNRVFANGAFGIAGGEVADQFTNNIAQGNGKGGMDVSGALISGNKALSNGEDGIGLVSEHEVMTVTKNVANGNQLDGFFQVNAGDPTLTTFSGNAAYFNKQLGIDGLPGTNDGGNNKADENGTAAQCTNIVCS